MSLMKQLTDLGLQDVVNHALRPSAEPATADVKASSAKPSRAPAVPAVPKVDKARRARRKAQEQLDRIEERKRNAEKALRRLKEERLQRKKRAEEMRKRGVRRRRKDPGRLAMKPSVPRQHRAKKKGKKSYEPAKLPKVAGAKAVPELPPPISGAKAAGHYRKPKLHGDGRAKDVKEVCAPRCGSAW